MQSLDAFAHECVRFFREDKNPIRRSRLDCGVDELSQEVESALAHEPTDLIRARRVSFGNEHEVLYPESIEQLEMAVSSRTLVLQALELSDGAIGRLCDAIADELQVSVRVSSYLSTPQTEAFGWHIDAWDSAVVQLRGTKVFHFRGDQRELLNPGDVLFFRRGVEHMTVTLDHSVHISVTIQD